MDREFLLSTIKTQFPMLDDAKLAVTRNFDKLLNSLDPLRDIITALPNDILLEDLQNILQYQVKMLMFLCNINVSVSSLRKTVPHIKTKFEQTRNINYNQLAIDFGNVLTDREDSDSNVTTSEYLSYQTSNIHASNQTESPKSGSSTTIIYCDISSQTSTEDLRVPLKSAQQSDKYSQTTNDNNMSQSPSVYDRVSAASQFDSDSPLQTSFDSYEFVFSKHNKSISMDDQFTLSDFDSSSIKENIQKLSQKLELMSGSNANMVRIKEKTAIKLEAGCNSSIKKHCLLLRAPPGSPTESSVPESIESSMLIHSTNALDASDEKSEEVNCFLLPSSSSESSELNNTQILAASNEFGDEIKSEQNVDADCLIKDENEEEEEKNKISAVVPNEGVVWWNSEANNIESVDTKEVIHNNNSYSTDKKLSVTYDAITEEPLNMTGHGKHSESTSEEKSVKHVVITEEPLNMTIHDSNSESTDETESVNRDYTTEEPLNSITHYNNSEYIESVKRDDRTEEQEQLNKVAHDTNSVSTDETGALSDVESLTALTHSRNLSEKTVIPAPVATECKQSCTNSSQPTGHTSTDSVCNPLPSANERLKQKLAVIKNAEQQDDDVEVLPQLKLLLEKRPSVIKNDLGKQKVIKKSKRDKDRNIQADTTFAQFEIPSVGNYCVFSHIETPFEFYIQMVDDGSSHLDFLTEKLKKKKTEPPFNSKQEAMNELGHACCAFIMRLKGWYRVDVIDPMDEDPTKLMVRVVDYGFKCEVSYTLLRKITKEIADLPVVAIKCYFPLLYPPNSTYNKLLTEWPEETIKSLRRLAGINDSNDENNFKLFKITFAQHTDSSVAVDMYSLDEGSEHITIGQTLIDLKLAVQIMGQYNGICMDIEDMLEDVDDFEKADNITEAILGYDAQDEARVCQFSREDGTCFKGRNCKLEHRILPKDGYTTDKIPVHRIPKNSVEVVKDQVYQVLVTHFKNCCTFYAQIIRTPYKAAAYTIDKSMFHLLGSMSRKANIANYKEFKVWPSLGEVVIVKHSSKKWLRGLVLALNANHGESESANIYLVDFGEEFEAKLCDLRQMTDEFLELPFQVIEIYLYNFQQKSDGSTQKANKIVTKDIKRKNFFAHIMSNNSPYKVKLTTINGSDVGMKLAKEGLVEPRKVDFNLDDNASDNVLLLE